MAEVQECKISPGIKLFGATITVKERSQTNNGHDDQEPKNSDQTVEKRPDKIIPCPRYWTAGGALRNVPVGAGRRKMKPPCRSLSEFSEGCLFDASGGGRLGFDGVGSGERRSTAVLGSFSGQEEEIRRRR
ncbi:hypothetical protein DH2020_041953 [Rehmannia glutinosa]|uniref:Dof-type domain-containing protein n=1 Tax=Rehmannia glutinosa TaxID=99300 RepID=A0ABR0UP97_REHGL